MPHLTQLASNFNSDPAPQVEAATSDHALRRRFLSLGAELHSRGQQPVAQFVSELADLAPDLAEEIQLRLEAYTRIPIAIYQALGADRFSRFMVAIDGGQK